MTMTPPDRPCACGAMTELECPCTDVDDTSMGVTWTIHEPTVGTTDPNTDPDAALPATDQ